MPKLLLPVIILLSVLFLAPNFVDYNINESRDKVIIHEKFDPSLTRLNSLSKLEQYTDSLAITKNIRQGTLDYAVLASEVVSERFYHKYATQNLNENWIASLAQKITGLSLSSKITADDILTRAYGYCGQQNTVLMELLQRKKLNCRVLYPPKHFVIQSYINGKWCYLDADGEPNMTVEQRLNDNWLHSIDSLKLAYKNKEQWVDIAFGTPVIYKIGKINEKQGTNAQIFQLVTKILSKTAFLFPLLWYVYLRRKSEKAIATNNTQQTTPYGNYHFYGNERAGSAA